MISKFIESHIQILGTQHRDSTGYIGILKVIQIRYNFIVEQVLI